MTVEGRPGGEGPRQYGKGKRKGGYESRGEARGGMPETIEEAKRKCD